MTSVNLDHLPTFTGDIPKFHATFDTVIYIKIEKQTINTRYLVLKYLELKVTIIKTNIQLGKQRIYLTAILMVNKIFFHTYTHLTNCNFQPTNFSEYDTYHLLSGL